MPRHKQVPTLQRLSLRGVGSLVVAMAPHVVSMIQEDRDLRSMAARLQVCVDFLSRLLASHVPHHLFDDAAVEVLESVKALIEGPVGTGTSSCWTEREVVESLTEVVLNSRLKRVELSKWPRKMQLVLYKNLEKTTGLERLELEAYTSCDYNNFIGGIPNMKNLRYFCCSLHCNDAVIEAIGENCPHIQCIDVRCSRAVTDESVPFLLKCTKLVELYLWRTSVTALGLAQLLAGLPNLQDIELCDQFGHVLRHLHHSFANNRPFGLRKIQTRSLSTEDLRLLVDMFPKIEFVSLCYVEEIYDLTVLISLNNLKDLKLSCAFYGDYLKRLIAVRGNNITKLHFEDVEELNGNALVDISQFCPKLKSLVFYKCEFTGNTNVSLNHITVQPFLNLEQISWINSGELEHLQFILEHALNIRSIQLGASLGITHQTIVSILEVNPMKYLEEFSVLRGSDTDMRTVELLLANCSNLKVLSDLNNWQGISVEELQTFKEYIKSNNFDLDIRPTLQWRFLYRST